MNKDRHSRIIEILKDVQSNLVELENIKDEEQAAFDNLPESLQESEKGEIMGWNIDYLESFDGEVSSAICQLCEDLEIDDKVIAKF